MSSVRLAGVLAMLVFGASQAGAQAVSGRLLDAGSGEPVAGALITLLDADGVEVTTTVTSARGTYHVRAPGAGQFRLRVERIGFQTLEQQVTVAAGQTATADFAMMTEALGLDEIVVTGTAGAGHSCSKLANTTLTNRSRASNRVTLKKPASMPTHRNASRKARNSPSMSNTQSGS